MLKMICYEDKVKLEFEGDAEDVLAEIEEGCYAVIQKVADQIGTDFMELKECFAEHLKSVGPKYYSSDSEDTVKS